MSQGQLLVMGSIMSCIMFGGMVKTIRSGNFGVYCLAILAVVATCAVSQYVAAKLFCQLQSGGDA